MKKLIFPAAAFILLLAAALFLSRSRDVQPLQQTSQLELKLKNSVSNSDSNSNSRAITPAVAATTPKRTVANAATALPATEDVAFAHLQSASQKPWSFKRADFSPTIRTLSQGSLTNETAATPREAADSFVKYYARGLFGVDPATVKFNREEVTDRTRLIYDQVINGVPVYGGSLSLFFENGALTRVQNDLAQGEIENTSKAIAVQPSFDAYNQQTKNDATLTQNKSNRTVLYPTGTSLIYVSEFVTRENDQSFHVVYDPNNQFVIQRRPSAIQ